MIYIYIWAFFSNSSEMNFIDLRGSKGITRTSSFAGMESPWVADSAVTQGMVGPEEKDYNYIRGRVRENETQNDLEKKCRKIDDVIVKAVSDVKDALNKKDYAAIFQIIYDLREGVEGIISNHHDSYYDDQMGECYTSVLMQLYECEHGSMRRILSGDENKFQRGKQHLIEVIFKFGESIKEFLERFRKLRFKKANAEDDSSHELSRMSLQSGVKGMRSKTSSQFCYSR
jgi:hypothetical protein